MNLEWIDTHADRVLAVQRSQVDTAKLLSTFAAGVSATIVGTGLQVGAPASGDLRNATYVLGVTVLLILPIVLADRIRVADHDVLLKEAGIRSWTNDQFYFEWRNATLIAVEENRTFVRLVKMATTVQLTVASVGGALAASTMLS
jgi:hypothetical protein